jgi:hypothetical protein
MEEIVDNGRHTFRELISRLWNIDHPDWILRRRRCHIRRRVLGTPLQFPDSEATRWGTRFNALFCDAQGVSSSRTSHMRPIGIVITPFHLVSKGR